MNAQISFLDDLFPPPQIKKVAQAVNNYSVPESWTWTSRIFRKDLSRDCDEKFNSVIREAFRAALLHQKQKGMAKV
jgi:hypothetical protein